MPVAVTTRGHLAQPRDRAGIGDVADLLVDRQRFAGERRLVDAEIVAADELDVGRDDAAERERDEVAGNELAGGDILPRAVAHDPRLQRQPLLEQRDGVVGLELLPEADARR